MSPESATDQFIRLLRARSVTVVDKRNTLPLRAGYAYKTAYPTRTLNDILWLVAHHEGTPDGSRGPIEKVNAFQIGTETHIAFPGLAYLGTIDGDGTLQIAWPLSAVTWSNGDKSPTEREGVGIYNWQGAAFMFAGNDPTEKQVTTLKEIKRALETVTTRHMIVRSHRDVCGPSDTDCAGDVLESRIAEIQAA